MYCYDYKKLKQITQTENGFAYVKSLLNFYNENYAKKPILALNYSYAKLYHLDGNRVKFQDMYFERRKRLMILQVLAVADDTYIEDLEEIISAICDEYTWVVPAHTHSEIDLFSAETAMYLAETVYVLQDKLSKDIRERVYRSVENKIVKIYENVGRFHWENFMNNWMAVCGCGIGLAYLYLFPERFDLVKERILNTVNCYIKALDCEGYCNEGYSYWVYGFGFFCLFYDVYEQLTGEHASVLDSEIIKKTLQYGQNAILDETVFLPFADGGSKGEHDEAVILSTVERMFDINLYINGNELLCPSNQALGYRVLAFLHRTHTPKDKKEETIYYKESQVFIRQNGNYVFTVKGGHNHEFHNHNDVGAFSIIQDGKQYIADIGVGEYTKQYFTDEKRYEIFTCSSLSHSVPIVDNQAQTWGREYYGEIVSQDERSITIDIAKAYKDSATKLLVEYRTEREGVIVTYRCDGIKEKVIFRFISFIEPRIIENRVFIDTMEITTSLAVCPKISKREYAKYLGKAGVAYTIDYELNKTGNIVASFSFGL